MIEVKNGNLHIAGSGLEILNDTCNVIFMYIKIQQYNSVLMKLKKELKS